MQYFLKADKFLYYFTFTFYKNIGKLDTAQVFRLNLSPAKTGEVSLLYTLNFFIV